MSASYQFIQNGRLTTIIQSGQTRSTLYTQLPTARELGFKGPDAKTWFAVFARKDTSTVSIDRFGEVVKLIVANNPAIQEFKNTGMTMVNYSGNRAGRFFNQEVVQFEHQ
jgi:tripartite-type tricarboxylate transporter receptor subunit TctC